MPQSIRRNVIVFEYLEMQGKYPEKEAKTSFMGKRDIQKLCEHQAHRNRIRVGQCQNATELKAL